MTVRTVLQNKDAAGRHLRSWSGTVWILELRRLAWLGIRPDCREGDLHSDLVRIQVLSVNHLDFQDDAVGELRVGRTLDDGAGEALLDDRRRVTTKLTRARHLRQFDLGRLVDVGGFTLFI